jgi:hypothetical protein
MISQNVLSIDVGSGNFAVCLLELPAIRLHKLENWRLGDAKALPASQLVDRMLAKLSAIQEVPDVVLIEQQMRGAHVNLALAFGAYACLRTRFPQACVKFVKPANKFKDFAKFVPWNEDVVVPVEYAKRKRLAVKLADTLLQDYCGTTLGTLCPDAKKDDVADAFLQAFCV